MKAAGGVEVSPRVPAPVDSRPRWSVDLHGPKVVAGAGSIEALPELVRSLGAHSILLVTDPGLIAAGWVERARRLLEGHSLVVEVFGTVGPNPGDRELAAGIEVARATGPEALVALGGGSVLDAAKGIALLLAGGGRVSDYRGYGRARGTLLPMIAIPATAGTGSEAQSYAVLTDGDSGAKMACGDRQLMFRTVILDPEVTSSAPLDAVAAATLDALAHAVESHVSKRANPLSRLASREAFRLLDRGAEAAIAGSTDTTTRAELQLGAFLAGRAIELSMLGAAHACANPLTRQFGVLHGIAVGTMLPRVVRLNANAARALYHELDAAGPESLATRLELLLAAAGFPGSLREHGIDDQALPALAADAATQWTGAFNPVPLDASGFEALYREAW